MRADANQASTRRCGTRRSLLGPARATWRRECSGRGEPGSRHDRADGRDEPPVAQRVRDRSRRRGTRSSVERAKAGDLPQLAGASAPPSSCGRDTVARDDRPACRRQPSLGAVAAQSAGMWSDQGDRGVFGDLTERSGRSARDCCAGPPSAVHRGWSRRARYIVLLLRSAPRLVRRLVDHRAGALPPAAPAGPRMRVPAPHRMRALCAGARSGAGRGGRRAVARKSAHRA